MDSRFAMCPCEKSKRCPVDQKGNINKTGKDFK